MVEQGDLQSQDTMVEQGDLQSQEKQTEMVEQI